MPEASSLVSLLNDTKSGHEQLMAKILEKLNVTNLIKTQVEREGRFLEGGNVTMAPTLTSTSTVTRSENMFVWDPYRINTVAYIGLALLCVILLGIVSGFYAR